MKTTYGFSDGQVAQVYRLVHMQQDILGAADRNHAHYVKRAAQAVAAGEGQLLDTTLGNFKQAATSIAVRQPAAYFHGMWTEAFEKRQSGAPARDSAETSPPRQHPTKETKPSSTHRTGPQRLSAAISGQFGPESEEDATLDPRERQRRDFIAKVEATGVTVPDRLRRARLADIVQWYEEEQGARAPTGTPSR